MQKTSQTGRSMIEMLGVLAIIGVLSVGGLSVIAKARQEHMITQLLSQTNNLITESRRMSCDYEEEYGSYTNMLFQSRAVPDGIVALSGDEDEPTPDDTPITSGKATAFLLEGETVAQVKAGENNTYEIKLSHIPESACTALTAASWGKKHTNGYSGAEIGDKKSDGDTRIDPDTAATACAQANPKLTLTFKACPKNSESETSSD